MKSYIPTKVATYVFATVFLIFGIMHFFAGKEMAAMVPIPGGIFWVYLTGAAMIAYAIATYMNHKYEKLAGYLLALMLMIIVLMIHLPLVINGDSMAMISMLKDIALAAAAIVLANHSDMS